MRFLLSKGGLYKVYNNNLLYHGCVPLKDDGSLKTVRIYGRSYKGKSLFQVSIAACAIVFILEFFV